MAKKNENKVNRTKSNPLFIQLEKEFEELYGAQFIGIKIMNKYNSVYYMVEYFDDIQNLKDFRVKSNKIKITIELSIEDLTAKKTYNAATYVFTNEELALLDRFDFELYYKYEDVQDILDYV